MYRQSYILFLCFLIGASNTWATGKQGSSIKFLENKGQWDPGILFTATPENQKISLLKDGVSFSIVKFNPDRPEENSRQVWKLNFLNISDKVSIQKNEEERSVYSYLKGNDPSKWVIHPGQYNSILYKDAYPSVDIRFYGKGNQLEYDYILRSGARLTDIACAYEGVDQLETDHNGNLLIRTGDYLQLQKAPVAWQMINGIKRRVAVHYKITGKSSYVFEAAAYDPRHELIIDPLFQLVWSSYTQATGFSNNINYSFANAMDKQGNVYLTGMVDGTFPVTPGSFSGPGAVVPEIFVAKFSSDGTTMLYSTYLPANSSEHGSDIAVDDSGRAYVTGVIDLNITGITNFPSTANAFQPAHNGGSDAFLTVLTADGSALVYSSFLGGSNGETGYGIVLDQPGIAYVTGTTSSNDFPQKNSAAFPSGDNHAFVSKFDISQSGTASLLYSLKIGAGVFNSVFSKSIDINSAGEAFITGVVLNGFGSVTFPVTPGAYSTVWNGGMDNSCAYGLKLSSTFPVSIIYSTYLGPGNGAGVAVHDATNEAFFVGSTRTFTFGVTPGSLQPVHGQDALGNPNADLFILRMNSTGTALQYGTFFGGELSEAGTGIAVNSAGEAYVSAIAQSLSPTSPGAYQPSNAGSTDFLIAHINATGTAYACGGSTYVGGSDSDYSGSFYDYPSPKISLQDHGGFNDTLSLSSTSHSQDFPTTPGVYGPVKVNSIADQPVFFKLTCLTTSAPPPVAQIAYQQQASCQESILNFTDSSSNNPTSWQWYFPGATPATSTQQHPQSIVYSNPGSHVVSLVTCNNSGCDSVAITIQVNPTQPVAVQLGNDTTICSGNSISIETDTLYINYQWYLNGNNTGAGSDSILASQPGLYTVIVTDANGCTGTDSLQLGVNQPLVQLDADSILCNQASISLTATAGFTTYEWFFNGQQLTDTGNILTAVQSGTYTVQVSDSIGCKTIDTALISVASVNAVFTYIANRVCNGIQVTTDNQSTGAAGYQWNLSDGNQLAGENIIHVFAPDEEITVQLIAVNGSCSDTATLAVQYQNDVPATFPNILTPNGDHVNDCFNLKIPERYNGCFSLTIYNRWGGKVKSLDNLSECWNGKSDNGTDLPEGVYYYHLEIASQKSQGMVTITR